MATSSTPAKSRPRLRHPWLFALPDACLPEQVVCQGNTYHLVETFKHDFFAATGLYRRNDQLAVLKIGRTNELFSLPMSWAGRFLARREVALYQQAHDLPGVPRFIGRVGPTGFLHEFVPGRPLRRRDVVSDAFFAQLRELLDALHRRHIAYVDLNKRENVLVGDDGRPYLIDFQISLRLAPLGWCRWPLVQWLLRRFQQADIYHCLKHKRRLRPDLLTPEERRLASRVSVWIRLHRWIARPLTHVRRWILRRLRSGDRVPVTGSAAK